MKIDEMNVVITGVNGVLASYLLEYFSVRAAYVVGTVRQLAETAAPKNNEAIIEMDPLDNHSIDEAIRTGNTANFLQKHGCVIAPQEHSNNNLSDLIILKIGIN